MDRQQLWNIWKKMIFLIIFSFIVFLILVNIFRISLYMFEVNNVIGTALKEDEKQINVINNHYNDYKEDTSNYDFNVAHSANQLNYVDAFKNGDLKNSDWDDGINILLTGSDKYNSHESRSRSDVIIIIRINRHGQLLSFSIPRDTLIEITDSRGRKYQDKIGHSMYWSGLDGLKESVEKLIGSPIYRVVIIDNFRSFEAFLAILGGVDIDKHLEGKLGIQWIRNRTFRFGDIERCRRQQVFMKKAFTKLWKITKGGNYFISSVLFYNMRKVVQTDLTKDDFKKIWYLLKTTNFTPETEVFTAVLPGHFGTYNSKLLRKNNLSCWIPEEGFSEKLYLLFYTANRKENFLKEVKVEKRKILKMDLKLL